jgi:hypothetical protein
MVISKQNQTIQKYDLETFFFRILNENALLIIFPPTRWLRKRKTNVA